VHITVQYLSTNSVVYPELLGYMG